MKVKWGNKNESVTFLVTEIAEERSDEKLFLYILEKQVCDREILQVLVRARIGEAQSSMNTACRELNNLKEKSLWGWLRRVFG